MFEFVYAEQISTSQAPYLFNLSFANESLIFGIFSKFKAEALY